MIRVEMTVLLKQPGKEYADQTGHYTEPQTVEIRKSGKPDKQQPFRSYEILISGADRDYHSLRQ